MNRKLKRFLCVFLSAIIIIQVIPLNAFAKDIVQKRAIENVDIPTEANDVDIKIDEEIVSLRTENSKTFLTDDNGYYQITSATPIHNYNDGEWVDIANTKTDKIVTVNEAEEYVDEQIQAYSSSNIIQNSNDRYVDDCETLIKNYFSNSKYESKDCYTIRSSKLTKKAAEIYIKPYFPTEHSVFVTQAKIEATVKDILTNYNEISVNRITQDWDESLSITKKLSSTSSYYDLAVINLNYDEEDEETEEAPEIPEKLTFDFTNYCNYASLGLYNNYGVALTTPDNGTEITFSQIKVSMYFHELNDTDSRFETEQIDMGRAGTVYINDYTCSPTIIRDEMGLYGEIAPVGIQTIFNPLSDEIDNGMGTYTRVNYNSTIEYDSDMYYWKTCEGENLYFTKSSINTFTAKTSDKKTYTLTVKWSGNSYDYTNYNNVVIADSDGKTFNFVKYSDKGYLIKIVDGSKNKNEININYETFDDSKYNITSITDGIGREYRFTYKNGYLSNISAYDANGNAITINDNGNDVPISIDYSYEDGKLSKVSYSDQKSVTYEYANHDDNDDNNGIYKLQKITNIDGTYVTFSYEGKFSNESYKLASYILHKSNDVVEEVNISEVDENIYERTFDSTMYDNPKKLVFDKFFNMIYLSNYNGVEYHFNYDNNELKYILPNSTTDTNYIKNGEFTENKKNSEEPLYWELDYDYDEASIEIVECNDEHVNEEKGIDEFCLHMVTDSAKCRAYQIIESDKDNPFIAGNDYILSGSICNDNPLSINDNRKLSIAVYDTIENDGIYSPDNCIYIMDFDDTSNYWQSRKSLITLTKDTPALIVFLYYDNMYGECDFDSISLVSTTAQNTLMAEDVIPSSKIDYSYNNNNSITEEIKTSVLGKTLGTYYGYDSTGNYLSKVTSEGIPTYYSYNSQNGLLESKGSHKDTSKNAQFDYTAMGLLNSVKQATTQIDGIETNIQTNYTYENDRIKTIEHNGTCYVYDYDPAGRIISISEGTNDLITYSYKNNRVNTITYSNGATVSYTYNSLNYITEIKYSPSDSNGEPIIYKYSYDDYGNVVSYEDSSNNTTASIDGDSYTLKNNETNETIYSSNKNYRSLFGINSYISRSRKPNSLGQTLEDTVDTFSDNVVTTTTLFDSIGRTFETVSRDKSASVRNICEYMSNGNKATNLVSSYYSSVFTNVSNGIIKTDLRISRKTSYTYTDEGQIENIYRKSVNKIPENTEDTTSSELTAKTILIKHYEYDNAGEIILDANFDSKKVIKYKYNDGGNLISKTIYQNDDSDTAYQYDENSNVFTFYDDKAETVSYGYDKNWTDLLTSYNGNTITYDEYGNPVDYFGTNILSGDVSGKMNWDGTRLTSFDDGNNKYFYKYSADGYRTEKLICDSKDNNIWDSRIEYVYEGDTLAGYKTTIYEKDTNHTIKSEIVITLIYNGTKEAVGINADVTSYEEETPQNTSIYYSLLRDAQGNITDMYSSDENIVFHYSYDAYGNCTFTFSGIVLSEFKKELEKNSSAWVKLLLAFFMALTLAAAVGGTIATTQQTYRGYICDYETGLFYSQNRYYSPSWGRFINLDDTNMLTQNKGEVFGANLYNYCNNDPVNNVDLSGYAPTSYETSNNILTALNIEQINSVDVGVVPSKMIGKVENELTIFGMGLSTVANESERAYWRRVFGHPDFAVGKYNGYNYMNTVVDNENGAASMYKLSDNNSPYKIN